MTLWHTKQYPAWFTADTAAAAGASLQGVTVTLAAYALSGSVTLSGWLATGCLLAHQIATVVGGTFVDRHNRRTLMIVDATVGVATWTLIALSLAFGGLNFPLFTGLLVVSYAVHGLLGEASDAMLRSIIDIRDYPKASSINQGRDAAVQMAGSPAGGALYAVAPWLPFLVSAVLYALSGAAAVRLKHRLGRPRERDKSQDGGAGQETAGNGCDGTSCTASSSAVWGAEQETAGNGREGASCHISSSAVLEMRQETVGESCEIPSHGHTDAAGQDGERAGFLEDFLAGWKWGLTRKRLVPLLIVAALVNFAMNVVLQGVQLSLVASGTSGARVGLIDTGMCVAMLAGSVVSAQLAERVHVSATVCVAIALYAALLAPMLLSQEYWVLLVCFSVSSLPLPLLNAALQGFVFAKTPPELQGRAGTVMMVPAMALSMFSGAVAGSLLAAVGFAALVASMMTVMGIAIALMLAMPAARSIPAAAHWNDIEL